MLEQATREIKNAPRVPSRAKSEAPSPSDSLEDRRIAAFGREIDALRREIEPLLGEEDAQHIRSIGKLSQRLEWLGRGLIHFSFEPVSWGLGTAALWAHKSLELMEIGHMALHGAYDGLPDTERFQSEHFHWKAPIDEASWKVGHNVRHHQYTNIEGRDPDLNFGQLRLSPRVPYQAAHVLQPVTNVFSWFGFATAINLHVTGLLQVYLNQPASEAPGEGARGTVADAHRTFLSKWARYYGREYLLFPLLAGPFFGKVLLANWLSDVGRDLYAGAIIYCGHVGARDFPSDTEPATRAHWYVMQVEAARDVEQPRWLSILSGGLDLQIEHHLFPRFPPNRLRQVAPRVREICREYGVEHHSDSWPRSLRAVFGELRRLASRNATIAA
jgi:NADPH-dependent stearoyl-CoA 9-desaturase